MNKHEEEALELEIDELAGGEGWDVQRLVQIWERRVQSHNEASSRGSVADYSCARIIKKMIHEIKMATEREWLCTLCKGSGRLGWLPAETNECAACYCCGGTGKVCESASRLLDHLRDAGEI